MYNLIEASEDVVLGKKTKFKDPRDKDLEFRP